MGIRKIIKEEIDNFDWVRDIQPMKPEMEFLKDNFDNLQKVIKGDKTFYVDSEQKPLFMYYQDSENGRVWVDWDRIWSVLRNDFGLDYGEIKELIRGWLEEAYNLRGFTPEGSVLAKIFTLEETYNLMGLTPKFITSTLNLTKSYLSSNK